MASEQFLSVEDHGGEKRLRLDKEVVKSLLMSDEIADKPVVVISVAGAFRTGKSFLLNAMTRYLKASDKSCWLDDKSESFPWKTGCEAHTNGMVMSHPIPITLQSGEEAALLLMDTQGIFDDNFTTSDSTRIFALSTLLSSVQVFNVMNNLKSDDLDNLQLFAEYGRLAMNSTDDKPFQKLLFLIRDWYDIQNYPLGSQGGNDFVDKRMSSNRESLARQRQHIKACFTDVSGFLLPYPGEDVAGSPTFAGDAKDMKPQFITALKDLMSTLFSPEKLSVKMNGSVPMTCRHLATFIEAYTDLFRSEELPDAKSILQAVADTSNMAIVNHELIAYMKRMNGLLGKDATMLNEQILGDEHQQAKADALKSMERQKVIRDTTKTDNHYSRLLADRIDEWFKESQNLFKEKCNLDSLKASLLNDVVDECIKSFSLSMNSVTSNKSMGEREIREAYQTANEEALLCFNSKIVTFGSHRAEESRLRLERTMKKTLSKALADNTSYLLVQDELLTYKKRMEGLLGDNAPMIDEMLLCEEHCKAKTHALQSLELQINRRYPNKADKYYSYLLVCDVEEWFKTSQHLFKEKCERDKLKARKANDALVDECFRSFETTMTLLHEKQLKDEKEVREEANKAQQEALRLFETRVITLGYYTAGDSRTKLAGSLVEASSAWWNEYQKQIKSDANIAKALKIAAVAVGAVGAAAAGPVGWVTYAVVEGMMAAVAAGGAVVAGSAATATGLAIVGNMYDKTKSSGTDETEKSEPS